MMMNKSILKTIIGMAVGAVLGFSYYYFVGCKSGSCPITGNPYISTAYGAGIGLLLTMSNSKKRKQTEN